MKRNAILTMDSVNGYALDMLYNESKKRDINLYRYYENIPDDIDFTLNRKYLEKFVLTQRGMQINRVIDGIFWRDKSRQTRLLTTGCKKPLTVLGKGFEYQYLVNYLGSPFIAKESISSQGSGVYMIKTQTDFNNAKHCDLFQEVIWDSLGKDIRVFAIGGEPIRCMLRTNNESFKSNFHQGGTGSIYECDSSIKNIVDDIYNCTKLDIMGIDLLLGKDDYYFCELNVNPGFEELDRVFKSNTAGDILDYCIHKCELM